jgi:hypothetical protein
VFEAQSYEDVRTLSDDWKEGEFDTHPAWIWRQCFNSSLPIIKRTARFAEVTVAGLPIIIYQKDAEVSDAYRKLGEEISSYETTKH